jgi:hypothetical protein
MSFSLRWLFGAIALASLFAAAFMHRTPLWASVIVTATLGLLVIVSSHCVLVPRNRPFTLTFLLAGWGYIAVIFLPFLSQTHRLLLPTRLLGAFWISSPRDRPGSTQIKIGDTNTGVGDAADAINAAVEPFNWVNKSYYYSDLRSFFYIGDCISAILIAFLLGIIASYCVGRSKGTEDQK